ncbi:hypothetical protein ANSO36C_40030 [Nostoc cf. commune SO-36]|uniref:Uncharacterized protein n=1 Tax=Nostoc cf. commune SO-36 TaxID=449208 RepID=A0ABN6Q4N9_NOSCO|nr:hypothetical protein ANSO36C_40030 [Nostoc cf. commune SO-36]
MFTLSETSILAAILLLALGILGWGFYRARPFGKLGILAWLQSVVLMAPWLLFFGLFAAGIYINIAGILFLVVTSAGLYVYLGRQLRAAGQDAILKQRATERLAAASSLEANSPQPTAAELKPEIPPIPEEDLNAVKGIFGIDTFFATETIAYQDGAIFKGNLRGEPEETHNRLTASLRQRTWRSISPVFSGKYRRQTSSNRPTQPQRSQADVAIAKSFCRYSVDSHHCHKFRSCGITTEF